MNWFDASGLTNLAKTALKEAQKTIDKALEIEDDGSEDEGAVKEQDRTENTAALNPDFFSSWGLTVSAEKPKHFSNQQKIITESPTKSSSQGLWGSFTESLFEPNSNQSQPLVDIQDSSSTDASMPCHGGQQKFSETITSEKHSKIEQESVKSQRLSIVSSESGRNSSDSVEVLGSQSLKTTPDSETSIQSPSSCSDNSPKGNSESVEILPDSLISPSSIECLGFDSYCSDVNNKSDVPFLNTDHKNTSVEPTTSAVSADSISLVADDDDDTVSYNSISECTAPTILDVQNDDKLFVSSNSRTSLMKSLSGKKINETKDSLEIIPIPILSENSSNDGSWSDRTLQPDNENLNIDVKNEKNICVGKTAEYIQADDSVIEKFSDTSSFCNIPTEMLASDSSTYVKVHEDHDESEPSAQKNKERISPVSSDKSEIVKIGSDRMSGHTSGDDIETATSSDIEIIPSPNGENHNFRQSPAKAHFKSKIDGATSPSLVDLILGKSITQKKLGHSRDLSGVSVQSNTSDDSQSSETEKLLRRLSEMAETLEARENKLIELSSSNADLSNSNSELKLQIDTLLSKHEIGDINIITEDYTQRMSALEKKFQLAIREKDQLRQQLDGAKIDSKKGSADVETLLKEKDEIIAQLQEEGEKLAKQQLTQSNIIKKLRSKEKDAEQIIKGLRDKIAEQNNDIERLKRQVTARDETEVTHIENVYKLSNANKHLENELNETKSSLDDVNQRLETTRVALDAARKELIDLQRSTAELRRKKMQTADLEKEKEELELENERLSSQLNSLRAKIVQVEHRAVVREENLRRELAEVRLQAGEAAAAAAGGGAAAADSGALLAQLAAVQQALAQRDLAHHAHAQRLHDSLAMAEMRAAKCVEMERISREEASTARTQLAAAQTQLELATAQLDTAHSSQLQLSAELEDAQRKLDSATREQSKYKKITEELQSKLKECEKTMESQKCELETERQRVQSLQEQMLHSAVDGGGVERERVSPPHSITSDTFSGSMWPQDDNMSEMGVSVGLCGVEEVLARLGRREGEVRALGESVARLQREKQALAHQLAHTANQLANAQGVQEQYEALLQMYGEKEEQLAEARLDLADVTQLYKQQLHEIIALKQQLAAHAARAST